MPVVTSIFCFPIFCIFCMGVSNSLPEASWMSLMPYSKHMIKRFVGRPPGRMCVTSINLKRVMTRDPDTGRCRRIISICWQRKRGVLENGWLRLYGKDRRKDNAIELNLSKAIVSFDGYKRAFLLDNYLDVFKLKLVNHWESERLLVALQQHQLFGLAQNRPNSKQTSSEQDGSDRQSSDSESSSESVTATNWSDFEDPPETSREHLSRFPSVQTLKFLEMEDHSE